jgi:hypothetical protein
VFVKENFSEQATKSVMGNTCRPNLANLIRRLEYNRNEALRVCNDRFASCS